MAKNPGRRLTDAQLFAREQDLARQQRVRRKGHAESKTFIAGGEITTPLYIPPLFIAVDPSAAYDPTPEFKRIVGFRALLRVGTCTIGWLHNESDFLATHLVTAALAEFDVNLNVDSGYGAAVTVEDGDTIRPVIEAASGAFDLAAAVFMVTAAR